MYFKDIKKTDKVILLDELKSRRETMKNKRTRKQKYFGNVKRHNTISKRLRFGKSGRKKE